MKIYREDSLSNFNFYGGAAVTAEQLTLKDFEILDMIFEDTYPEGLSETEINDIFWFEDEYIAECLGYESMDQLIESRKEK